MSAPSAPTPVLAVDEHVIAAAIGVSVYFLRKDRQHRRRIPYYRLGSRVLYNLERVQEALQALEVGGAQVRGRKRAGAAA
jgi:hypothetical protein